MQNVIICEDSALQAEQLKQAVLALNLENIRCTVYQSAQELLKQLPQINAYSIFLLDVVMPNVDGITLAKTINRTHPHSCIIYVTAYLNTVTDAQDSEHCYFLLKNDLKARLPIAINKALSAIREISKTMLVTIGDTKVVIHMDDILYLERIKRYTYIVTAHEKLRVKEDLAFLQNKLSAQFHRCHNSFVVNFYKVTAFKKNAFILGTVTVPISRSYCKECETAFQQFIVNTI